jgi:hypothetical protein
LTLSDLLSKLQLHSKAMRHTIFYILLIYIFSISACFAQDSSEDKLCEDILKVKVQLDEQEALSNMSINAQINQVGKQNNAQINNGLYNSRNNNLMINQIGTYNHAQIEAYGNGLNSGISQNGNFNNAKLDLSGNNLDVLITQNGNNNAVQGNLSGINKQFFVSQSDNQNILKLNDISVNGIPAVIIEMNGKMAIEWNNGKVNSMPSQ